MSDLQKLDHIQAAFASFVLADERLWPAKLLREVLLRQLRLVPRLHEQYPQAIM